MSIIRRVTGTLLCVARVSFVPATFAQSEYRQAAKPVVPENATARSYGKAWDCDQGYRKDNDTCTAISFPENAYLTNTSYGSGWACERGFLAVGLKCVAIKLPANAHMLNKSYPPGWRCNCVPGALRSDSP